MNSRVQRDVSVILVNFHQAVLTKRCIDLLLRSTAVRFEIIVIDNSCSAKDRKLLRAISDKRVRCIFARTNKGCCEGYNLGIARAHGRYVFVLNNDTEIQDRYALGKMVRFMNIHPGVGVIQPKIKSLRQPAFFEYSGAAGGYVDVLGYPFCRGRIFQTVEKDKGQFDDIVPLSWASTCAFFARKTVLMKAGLFDPIYFAYAEEVDMCLAIWKMGYQVLFYPHATVYHLGETTWEKRRGRKTYLIHRNHLILYLKCFPTRIIFQTFILRCLFELISLVYYIAKNSNLHTIFVVAADVSCIASFPTIMKKRRLFYRRGNEFRAPLYHNSIVLEYFLHKKKYFKNLDAMTHVTHE